MKMQDYQLVLHTIAFSSYVSQLAEDSSEVTTYGKQSPPLAPPPIAKLPVCPWFGPLT